MTTPVGDFNVIMHESITTVQCGEHSLQHTNVTKLNWKIFGDFWWFNMVTFDDIWIVALQMNLVVPILAIYCRTWNVRDMKRLRIWAIGNSRAWKFREFLDSRLQGANVRVHENFTNLAISRNSRTFHALEHFVFYSTDLTHRKIQKCHQKSPKIIKECHQMSWNWDPQKSPNIIYQFNMVTFCDKWWYLVMFDDIWWFFITKPCIVIYHDLSWNVMIFYQPIQWCIT